MANDDEQPQRSAAQPPPVQVQDQPEAMADKYNAPAMDWTSSGDVYKRFQLFKQKADLIFAGPLAGKSEDYKVRMLLLWIDDKGLEIYNTACWDQDEDKLKLKPVWQRLEAYVKPRSNQILARFQLRCLKQGESSLEEFVTRARSLIDDGGYAQGTKEETLRDTLVFGIGSDKARRDANAIGNNLTCQQVYELAKTEECTNAQMDIISKGEQTTNDVHAVKSFGGARPRQRQPDRQRYSKAAHTRDSPKPSSRGQGDSTCANCNGAHSKDDICPAKNTRCYFCGGIGHYKRACRNRRRQIHDLRAEDDSCGSAEEGYTLDAIKTVSAVHGVASEQPVGNGCNVKDKVFARVMLNGTYKTRLKVDTGSDTCTITKGELHKSGLDVEVKPNNCILRKYGVASSKTTDRH